MNTKLAITALGMFFSTSLFADGYIPELTSQDQPWSIMASVGKGKYQRVYTQDGDTIFARLALANDMMLSGDFALGLEIGVQNGHHMRLEIPSQTIAVLKWLPVRTTLGPMIDLLLTAKSDPLAGSALFAQLKGGLAYRYWQMNYYASRDISQLAGEIQAGLGYPVTPLANLNLLYQGVFGSDPNPKYNPKYHASTVSNIPTLHAVLLGLSFNL